MTCRASWLTAVIVLGSVSDVGAQGGHYDAGEVICSYCSPVLEERPVLSGAVIEVPQHIREAFDRIHRELGSPAIIIRPGNVTLAAVTARKRGEDSELFLLVNRAKMAESFFQAPGGRPAALGILAHEFGHVLRGHVMTPRTPDGYQELQADEESGRILARMGLSVDDALLAVSTFADRNPAAVPPFADRVSAVRRGWQMAQPVADLVGIRVGMILNGDAGYARNIAVGFRAKADQLTRNSKFKLHFKETFGSPQASADDVNLQALEELEAAFPGPLSYIVTIGTGVSEFVHRKSPGVAPHIFIGVTDPVASGLVASLDADPARGNIAGTTYGPPVDKTIRFFLDTFPEKRFGFVYCRDFPQDGYFLDVVRSLGEPRITEMEAVSIKEAAWPALPPGVDILFGRHFAYTRLAKLEKFYDCPFVGFTAENLGNGAVLTYGPNATAIGEMAAERILLPSLMRSVALKDIPIVVPEDTSIGINEGAARAYQITIPADVLDGASMRVRDEYVRGRRKQK